MFEMNINQLFTDFKTPLTSVGTFQTQLPPLLEIFIFVKNLFCVQLSIKKKLCT